MSKSWSVVSTIDEPKPLVLAFVSYYLALGAEEVHIYLDRASEETRDIQEILHTRSEVSCTICDEAYWQQNAAKQPAHIPRRQRINATNAYRVTKSDWLLHCDADEYLGKVEAVLAALETIDSENDYVLVPVAERVRTEEDDPSALFSEFFRRPVSRAHHDQTIALYEPYGEMLQNNVAGHTLGKSFYRTGRSMTVGVHTLNEAGVTGRVGARLNFQALFHVDDLTERSFIKKLQQRIVRGHGPEKTQAPARKAQLQFVKDHMGAPETLSAFYRGLKKITPDQAQTLHDNGWLMRYEIDPLPSIAQYFPEARVALTVDEFDSLLELT
ncbi:glycosyltransferase family 2 protein [Tritonibacter mobilis]|uniref:glycosyltransferase family 2 protein n=1 Tax=Tritonibacter mobilis TaxID=379347 RepID=UPI0039A6964B